jgi:hypothetical protein
MTFIYTNSVETEEPQIVTSETPLEHLEGQALWVRTEGTVAQAKKEADVTIPEGDPTDKWSAAELKAYAAREEIDLGDAKNKGEVFAAITAVLKAKADSHGQVNAGNANVAGDVNKDGFKQPE